MKHLSAMLLCLISLSACIPVENSQTTFRVDLSQTTVTKETVKDQLEDLLVEMGGTIYPNYRDVLYTSLGADKPTTCQIAGSDEKTFRLFCWDLHIPLLYFLDASVTQQHEEYTSQIGGFLARFGPVEISRELYNGKTFMLPSPVATK